MAEELDGLEGIGDLDDEFGDQLDSFMDSEGGDDGELDSFFEDLSTIDDLEVQDDDLSDGGGEADDFGSEDLEDEVAPAAAAAAGAAAAAVSDDSSAPKADKKKKKSTSDKKPILIPGIATGAAGAILGAAAIAAMYLMAPPPPPMEVEEPALAVLEEPPPPPPPAPLLTEESTVKEPIPAVEPIEEIQEVEEIVVVEEPPPPTMDEIPVAPVVEAPQPVKRPRTTRFFVQVANCIYQECVDDYRYLLKRAGYATRVETVNEVNPMTEIVSTNLYGEEEASNLVNRINNENLITGQAYRKPSSSSYQISLGLFPDLTTANRVKAHLNQIYSAEVFFEARRSDQRIRNYRIYAGGFKTKNEALDLQKILEEKDRRFEGMFVVAMSE